MLPQDRHRQLRCAGTLPVGITVAACRGPGSQGATVTAAVITETLARNFKLTLTHWQLKSDHGRVSKLSKS